MEKPAKKHVDTSIRFDPELYEQLRTLAFSCRISINSFVQEAVREAVRKLHCEAGK